MVPEAASTAALLPQGHVLIAERTPFSEDIVHERSHQQLPVSDSKPQQRSSCEDTDFSMKDEYDCSRFTHKYHEYEQGQMNIIVKGRLKSHIDFWKIGCNDFILYIINEGYKIPLYSQPVKVICKNYKSALLEQNLSLGRLMIYLIDI
jgi:hypothetical protein